MNEKLIALLHYVAPQAPTPTHLRIIVAQSEFAAYLKRGEPITGTTWCKGREFVYPCTLGEDEWRRATGKLWRLKQPRWQVRLGHLLTAWAILKAVGR